MNAIELTAYIKSLYTLPATHSENYARTVTQMHELADNHAQWYIDQLAVWRSQHPEYDRLWTADAAYMDKYMLHELMCYRTAYLDDTTDQDVALLHVMLNSKASQRARALDVHIETAQDGGSVEDERHALS